MNGLISQWRFCVCIKSSYTLFLLLNLSYIFSVKLIELDLTKIWTFLFVQSSFFFYPVFKNKLFRGIIWNSNLIDFIWSAVTYLMHWCISWELQRSTEDGMGDGGVNDEFCLLMAWLILVVSRPCTRIFNLYCRQLNPN